MFNRPTEFCGKTLSYIRGNAWLSIGGFATGCGAGLTGSYFYVSKLTQDFLDCAQGNFFIDNAFVYNCTAMASDCYNTALNCTSVFNLDTLQQVAYQSAESQLNNNKTFADINSAAFFGIALASGVGGTLLFCGTKATVMYIKENCISHVSNPSELSRSAKEKCLSLLSVFSRNKTQNQANPAAGVAVAPSLLDTAQRNNLSDENGSDDQANKMDEKQAEEPKRIAQGLP